MLIANPVYDEFLELLKRKERSHAEALDAAMKELKEARTREQEARTREQEARTREEEERRQKEKALAELAGLKRMLEQMEK